METFANFAIPERIHSTTDDVPGELAHVSRDPHVPSDTDLLEAAAYFENPDDHRNHQPRHSWLPRASLSPSTWNEQRERRRKQLFARAGQPARSRTPRSTHRAAKKTGAHASACADDPPPARRATGAASFTAKSANSKLSPVVWELSGAAKRPRPVAVGPFVAITDTAIEATCPDTCPLKASHCYATTGFTKFKATRLNAAAVGFSADEVIAEEARLINRAFRGGRIPQDGGRDCKQGRDLRLHVIGDVGSERGARWLAGAEDGWRDRGGGSVWGFTHAWHDIPREAFGSISILASVEGAEEIEEARTAGYAAAIVVERFPSTKAFFLPGSTAKIVPCPAETTDGRVTCATCRLCLDDKKLLARNVAIAFQLHGPTKKKAAGALVQLRRKNSPPIAGREVAS